MLLDIAFGTRNAIPTIHRLKQASPQSKVVILSAFTEQVVVEASREAGAVAFVDKRLPLSELLCALSAALDGQAFVSLLSTHGMTIGEEPAPGFLRVCVARTDQRILSCLAAGMTQGQAGNLVHLTRKVVEYRLARLRRTHGFSRTTHLVGWFLNVARH